jgi:hypothetical protein
MGQSDVGDKNWEECTAAGGAVWTYQHSPLCAMDGEEESTDADFMKLVGI